MAARFIRRADALTDRQNVSMPAAWIDQLTTDAVRTFVDAYVGQDVGPVDVVGAGAWSRCFGFTDDGTDFVIRFGATDEDFDRDRRAAAFASSDLPVPMVTAIGPAFAGHFAISTRARGEPLESRTAAQWPAVLPSLLAALDAMRTVDLTATVGFGAWDRGGDAPHATWADHLVAVADDMPQRRTHGWTRRLADSVVGSEPFNSGFAALQARVVDLPDVRHVIHGDLINRNVLVDADAITAVFDWGCSAYGDFLYDIAWLEFWSPWHPALAALDIVPRAMAHLATIGVEVEAADERMRCCLLHIGLDNVAYTAHTGAEDDLVAITRRTLDLISST